MSAKGFGVEVLDKADLAEKVFPNKETVSKPVTPGHEVEHYSHKWKHGEPLSTTGKPPVSHRQAIAIGLSVAREGGTKGKAKKGKTKVKTEKSIEVVPGLGFSENAPGCGFVVEVVDPAVIDKGYVGFEKLAAKTSPAVAAAIGRKKYGEGTMKEMAKEGRTAPEQKAHLAKTEGKKAATAFGKKIEGEKEKK